MKEKPKRSQEKAARNARIIHQCEVRRRKQAAVAREYHVARQRVHAIIARHRKRMKAEAEKEAAEKEGEMA